ncbi:MAG: hypothetical protein H0W08_18700 [Acidobacteria bacterium]|nr:hypothetical protein [Acidobacteriota bacterium]
MIDRLGPADLAAVVFTRNNRSSQDYTIDRARLLAALGKTRIGFRDMTHPMWEEMNPGLPFRTSVPVAADGRRRTVAPRDAFKRLSSVVPTTRRVFGPGDRVSAVMRTCQGGSERWWSYRCESSFRTRMASR